MVIDAEATVQKWPQAAGAVAARRTVLIVSPHFPPSTVAGVHRARHLAKHLPSHGWRPIVIRVNERHYVEESDPALAALVPDSVEQVQASALPTQLTRLAGIGDIGLRAYKSLRAAIRLAARRENAGAVLITGSPFYPMMMAGGLRRQLGLPVVLDFQDPWVSAEGATGPLLSKGRVAHSLSAALEPRVVHQASWITSVSEIQNAEMAARYPKLDPRRMSAIPIGGDPDDFAALRATPLASPTVRLESGQINICYVGTFLPRAGRVVRAVFEAVRRLRLNRPDVAERLRFAFVGTSNQRPGAVATPSTHLVTPIAAEMEVGDMVHEHPARVPFLEALSLLSKTHGILLLGSDEPHYTASKIYPALMSGRPYLSLFHARSSSHEILTRAGGGATLAFEDASHLTQLVPAIANGLVRIAEAPESFEPADPAAYASYTAHAVAGRFARVFEMAAL